MLAMFRTRIEKHRLRRHYMNIKEIIESEFGLAVRNIAVLGQGLDSVAYRVNGEYIFKQSKHDGARVALKKEVRALDYLKGRITLQIPEIEYYSEGFSVCGYKEIRGEKLTPDSYKNMSDAEKSALVRSIAQFFREMHAIPLPDIEGLEKDIAEDYKGDHDALRELIYDKIPDKSKKYLDDLYNRILGDERITKYQKALCHNDLSCNHIIMRDNKAVGIIDFGDVAITDRDKDFVYLLEDSAEEIGREFGLRVLECYNHPDKDIPILKADLNEEYYPIELILGGRSIGANTNFRLK
jgi:aminoglycoside 2''-phosphotransferase